LKYYFFLSLILTTLGLQAQITINVRNFDPFEDAVFFADIEVRQNGNLVNIQKDNLFIIERNFSTEIIKVEPSPLGTGQRIFWIPNFDLFDSQYEARLNCFIGSQVGGVDLVDNDLNLPSFTVRSMQTGTQIFEVPFAITPAGAGRFFQASISYSKTILDRNGFTRPVSLDSITTNKNPNFRVTFVGAAEYPNQPPFLVRNSTPMGVNILFLPQDNDYQYDVITFHYHGGAKKYLKLTGNLPRIEQNKQLQLVYPNEKDTLIPCQEVQIKWKGYVPGIPVVISANYSTSRGFEKIGEVKDSVFNWTVPPIISRNLQIKINQEFVNNEPTNLAVDKNYNKVAYNPSSSKVATNTGNIIQEYDLNNNSLINTITLAGNKTINTLQYIDDDNLLVGTKVGNIDSIGILNVTSKSFVKNFRFSQYSVAEYKYQANSNSVIAIPSLSTQVNTINLNDGTPINQVQLNYPLLTLDVNEKENIGVLSKFNSEYEIFTLPYSQNNVRFRFKLDDVPLASKIAISPNKRYFAIACRGFTGTRTQVVIIDLERQYIMSILRNFSTELVGLNFDPTSSVLAVGNKGLPQILIYDLVSQSVTAEFSNSIGLLNDIEYSPVGNSLVTTANSGNSLVYRTFVKPETDINDSLVVIQHPTIEYNNINFRDEYVFNTQSRTFTASFCNRHDSPIVFNKSNMKVGTNFKIISPNEFTVTPNQCIDLFVEYTPLDTGAVADTMVFTYCSTSISYPIKAVSLNRNIFVIENVFDFGEVCVGDTLVKEIELIRNNDPAPLRVTLIQSTPISGKNLFIFDNIDTLLPAGATLKVRVKAVPDTFGVRNTTGQLRIYNSDKFITSFNLRLKGIGTFVNLSHTVLPFTIEDKKRTLTIGNPGIEPLSLNSASITPGNNYRVLTQFPIVLKPGDSTTIEIEATSNTLTEYLTLSAVPCLVTKYIPLVAYRGTSLLQIKDTTTNPKDDVGLDILMTNTENEPYKGIRTFEAEININKRLFFPKEVISKYGKGELVSNRVENNRRFIKFKVEGNFYDLKGTLATIVGVPGLAELDTTNINLLQSEFFGKSVVTTVRNGRLTVDDKCPQRVIISSELVNFATIYPNPSSDNITIEKNSNDRLNLKILDVLGNTVYSINIFENKKEIDITKLPIGQYRLVFELNGILQVENMSVVR